MGIEAASTISVSSSASVSGSTNSTAAAKTNSESSFKDEMSKVSETEKKEETKNVEKEKTEKSEKSEKTDSAKNDKSDTEVKDNSKAEKTDSKSKDKNTNQINNQQDEQNNPLGINLNNQMSLNDANMMLSTDIQQMIENSANVSGLNQKGWGLLFSDGTKTNINMTESDADFFINLTQNDNVNIQNMTAQAQNMLNKGAETSEVNQNFQVSQTLLNALSDSRQNNQPIRINFDENVSVILRVGKDGALSAQFIPGDKAVEQYLRQNIDTLRTTFDEQDLPYSDLSYSNSSREQNQRRRQEQQQGE